MPRALLAAALLATACATAPGDRPAPALSTADLVGTWAFEVMPLDRDTVLVTGTLIGQGNPPIWTMTLTGREPRTSEMKVKHDTVYTRTGPYPSALQKGVTVTTTGKYRLVNGELVGEVTSRYDGITTADSVARFRTRMRKVDQEGRY